MKEPKYINNDQSSLLTDFTVSKAMATPPDRSVHPLVVQEDDERFLIVDEFSSEAKSGIAISVHRIDNSILEKDENGETLYYAEEVFDSEDELYQNELHDSMVERDLHRTYTQIGEEIDAAMLSYGFRGQIGFNLLAAMRFSRFINVVNHDGVEQEINALAMSIGSPICTIEYDPYIENIAHNEELFKLLAYAKGHPNKPVFAFIKNLDGKQTLPFLRPIYPYIDSPKAENIITAGGRSMYIPHNIWFIFTIQKDDMPSRISRRLLRYASFLEYSLTRAAASKGFSIPMSIEELDASFKEASEQFFVNEEAWKQIDQFVAAINPISGYALQNKIARSLEDYMIVLKVAGYSDDEVLDISLSNNFIREAIITTEPNRYIEEISIYDTFDQCFGEDRMQRCRNIVKTYLSHFAKGGKFEHV